MPLLVAAVNCRFRCVNIYGAAKYIAMGHNVQYTQYNSEIILQVTYMTTG